MMGGSNHYTRDMSEQGGRTSEAGTLERLDSDASGACGAVRPRCGPAHVPDETTTAIASRLNGPLTALLLYMGEIKQHSSLLSANPEQRAYLQRVVEHALEQTERVCALVKQITAIAEPVVPTRRAKHEIEERPPASDESGSARRLAVAGAHRPLTKRELEVLQLISDGYSNKRGGLRMGISPRTFESHRAEAMRKLGARNTADLVRTALLLRLEGRLD
jgi:DNA-binding CsgD family transcriptional regulator